MKQFLIALLVGFGLGATGVALTGCGDDSGAGAETVASTPAEEPDDLSVARPDVEGIPVEGALLQYDATRRPPIDGEEVEKHQVPSVMGWGVLSKTILSGEFNGTQVPRVCNIDGRTCTGFTTGQQAVNNLTGLCGVFGVSLGPGQDLANVPDNSFQACIFPFSKNTVSAPNKKSWKWKFNASNCGANDPTQQQLLIGARRAFASASDGTGFVFTEVTSGENITVYCNDGTTEAALGANPDGTNKTLAFTYPYGPLSFAVTAPGALEENCESGTLDPNAAAGYPVYERLIDGSWTYNQIAMSINKARMKSAFDTTCGGTGDQKTAYAQWNIMHELGHGLGFQHQLDTSADANFMRPRFACQQPVATARYRAKMRSALTDLDIPKSSTAFTVIDEDLSCYSPDPR